MVEGEFNAMERIHESNESVKRRLEGSVQETTDEIEDNPQKNNREDSPVTSEEVYKKLIGQEVLIEARGQYAGGDTALGGLTFNGTYRGVVEIPPQSNNQYHVLEDGEYYSNTREWETSKKEDSCEYKFNIQLIAISETISIGDSREAKDTED